MKAISINTAREIGKRAGAKKIAVIAMADNGAFCITTWGRTVKECRELAAWAESRSAENTAYEIAREHPTGRSTLVANDPDAAGKIGV